MQWIRTSQLDFVEAPAGFGEPATSTHTFSRLIPQPFDHTLTPHKIQTWTELQHRIICSNCSRDGLWSAQTLVPS